LKDSSTTLDPYDGLNTASSWIKGSKQQVASKQDPSNKVISTSPSNKLSLSQTLVKTGKLPTAKDDNNSDSMTPVTYRSGIRRAKSH
jgi:hypothetical protein